MVICKFALVHLLNAFVMVFLLKRDLLTDNQGKTTKRDDKVVCNKIRMIWRKIKIAAIAYVSLYLCRRFYTRPAKPHAFQAYLMFSRSNLPFSRTLPKVMEAESGINVE